MKRLFSLILLAVAAFSQTSNYPAALDNDASLFVTADNAQSTLTTAVSAGATTWSVASGTGFAVNQIVTICDAVTSTGKCTVFEHAKITGIAGNDLTVTRGFANTTARAHAKSALVSVLWDKAHHDALKSAVTSIETALGPNLENAALAKNARSYNFTPQTPGGSLIAGGIGQAITLAPCPGGVSGTDLYHYLYISGGTGTAEAVLITGGTCVSGAASGTVTVTPANNHSGAWTIQSATSGIQEAIQSLYGASLSTGGKVSGGSVYMPAGDYPLYATLSIGNGEATHNSYGAYSGLNFIRLVGAGAGYVQSDGGERASTVLRWAGAAGGNPIILRGLISGVEMAWFKLDGAMVSGDLVVLEAVHESSLHDLVIANGGVDSIGVNSDWGNAANTYQTVYISQNQAGSSCMALGKDPNPSYFGNSQNTLVNVQCQFPGDKTTSYGLYFEGADNNSCYQCNAQGGQMTVTGATNATPIVLTFAASHGRASASAIRVQFVGGNTAANTALGSFYYMKTAGYAANQAALYSDAGLTTPVAGNGAYTSGGVATGPGSALYLKQATAPYQSFPLENAGFNSAWQGLITCDGTPGPFLLMPFPASDAEYLPNCTAWRGFAHQEFYSGTTDGYTRILGPNKFVRGDNVTGFAKFYQGGAGRMAVGDVDGYNTNHGDITAYRTATDATITAYSAATGSAIMDLSTAGAQHWQLAADRASGLLKLNNLGEAFAPLIIDSGTTGIIGTHPGADVASGSPITPTGMQFRVTGAGTLSTINLPFTGFEGCVTMIPTGAWNSNAAGNIANVITAAANVPVQACYLASTGKWYLK